MQVVPISSHVHHTHIASCHGNNFFRWSVAIRASNVPDVTASNDAPNPFPSLYGKTLVSIQECIDAHLQQKHRDQQSSDHPNNVPRLQFIDASWYHRPDPVTDRFRNPSAEFRSGPRLPNSHRVDIDALATTHELFPRDNPKKLPHMMPPADLFALAMDAYGIRQHNTSHGENFADHVVIYARRGAVFAPRTWFLFVAMGHDPKRVHWMQGSLEDWIESGGDVDYRSLEEDHADGVPHAEGYEDCFDRGILNVSKLYRSRCGRGADVRYRTGASRAANICDKHEVLRAVNEHSSLSNPKDDADDPSIDVSRRNATDAVIIDTRGSGYIQKGHMPSAIHLPYRRMVDPSNPLVLLPKEELHDLFVSRGIRYRDPNLKIILSCGSGVSVCHAFLALTILGREITEENTKIYDGSWMEWGREEEEDLPRVLPGRVT
ncbi:hypothetical protein ACHAW6_008558 [Cyclotella cf. meneghiniana]